MRARACCFVVVAVVFEGAALNQKNIILSQKILMNSLYPLILQCFHMSPLSRKTNEKKPVSPQSLALLQLVLVAAH